MFNVVETLKGQGVILTEGIKSLQFTIAGNTK